MPLLGSSPCPMGPEVGSGSCPGSECLRSDLDLSFSSFFLRLASSRWRFS